MPPNARVGPCSTIPLMIAPIACSRMPKCSTRPYGFPVHSWVDRSTGTNEAAFLIVVRFDSARSAEPPQSSGSCAARALITVPDAARVETSLPGSNTGSASAMPSGSWRAFTRSQSAFRSGFAAAHASNACCHSALRLGGALGQPAGALQHLVGDDEGLLRVPAEHLLRRRQLIPAERGAVDLPGVLLPRARATR